MLYGIPGNVYRAFSTEHIVVMVNISTVRKPFLSNLTDFYLLLICYLDNIKEKLYITDFLSYFSK